MVKPIYLIGGVVAIATLAIGATCASHFVRDNYKVKITGTERVRSGSGEDMSEKYVIFAEDIEKDIELSFENSDTILEGKFDSSDLQSKLKKAEKNGQVCDIETYGWRIPMLSTYKNIVDANCYDLDKGL
ncbi:DUF1523 family protein [Candidatus Woesearchaeota archaeon]|jgi:hypothetical protein|nr:DUF1523 family protein [Candidatus Woesearchaeota archaeon]MBT6519651.1 DUF1523 family protein [Candidatus Woesearchaeota archaeon]MBT7368703.1 DUF1523 family protein [Candidatus Woesearchaeota archaeon]